MMKIPKLSNSMHKGQSGRISIVGGCSVYTGAPFYAGMTAMRLGVDLVHVFCEGELAAMPLKCYSPELIVHPDQRSLCTDGWIDRMHAILIGPGLGRSESSCQNVIHSIIPAVSTTGIPLVIDADGLFIIQPHLDLIKKYSSKTILTPNIVEFQRLCAQLDIKYLQDDGKHETILETCKKLGNITIVLKGHHDIISNGKQVFVVEDEGSMRRCGGQGDVLAGAITAFAAWSHLSTISSSSSTSSNATSNAIANDDDDILKCCVEACKMVRLASKETFKQHNRSMIATDILKNVPFAFQTRFKTEIDLC